MKKYLLTCLLLTVPVMIWNIGMTGYLPSAFQPEVFGRGIPAWIVYGEQLFRTLFFVFAFLMPIAGSRTGWYLYGVGLWLYLLSWLLLILLPYSGWSTSLPGFLAPTLTPGLWMTGILRLGGRFSFGLPIRRWAVCVTIGLFLFCHITHTVLVYRRLYASGQPPADPKTRVDAKAQ
ncbi:MAG: hypothetical protein J7576_01615 [Siphonobacter aquaeclarae]|nr:hypothetical protein [Siphonobacter aquaeclarae]